MSEAERRMKETERRRAMRIIRSFIVRYPSLASGPGFWLVSTLRNFSTGGARFFCERTFQVGETMIAQLILPTSREPVVLKARVVWTKPSPFGMADLGVSFEPSDAHAKQALTNAANFFLTKKREAT